MMRFRSLMAAACVALVATIASPRAQGPQPAEARLAFVQLSDPQFGMFTSDKDFAQETANFEFAIASVNRLRPAFVIVTGDLVNKPGDGAQIAEYQRIAGKLDPAIPLYNIAGNHDVGNIPTPEALAAYRARFGKDWYTLRSGPLLGIVLNSSLIHSPGGAPDAAAEQERWLKAEITAAAASAARHVVIFQHHPWFLASPDEADQYFNIPKVRRAGLLALFHEAGIRLLVSGHYHRNAVATDGSIEAVTSGPVGKPLAGQSGIRIFTVTDAGITHKYYSLGEIPNAL